MKTNQSIHCRILTSVLGLGLCANTVFTQEPTTFPGRDQKGSQSRNGNQSNTNSPEQFLRGAAWCGLKEIRLSEIALRKTQDSELRSFAQMMVTDHTSANEELRQVAQRKGIQVPAANELETNSSFSVTGNREDRPTDSANRDRANQSTDSANRDADRAKRDRADDTSNRRGVREQTGGSTNQFNQAEGRESVLRAMRQLEGASGNEFDRLYLRTMLQDHNTAVQKFEQASQQSTDPEIRQFAATTLPKLRQHQQHVQRLAQSQNVTVNEGPDISEPRR
jgi:predicted outer membrane protein